MSRLTDREIARQLAEREDFEPPAGLLEKIKSEIPAQISVGTEVAGQRRSALPSQQRWLIAASLIAMVGAGVFALRVGRQSAMLSRPAEEAPLPADSPAAQALPAAPAPAAPAPLRELAEQQRAASGEIPLGEAAKLKDESRQDAAAPPAAVPPPPPAPRAKEANELRALGYVGGARRERSQQVAQPAAIPEPVEGDAEGVEGGVEGGVAGGVVGGVPGGVPAPVPELPARFNEQLSAAAEAPLMELRAGNAARVAGEEAEPDSGRFFKSAGTNPFIETAADRLSTFGLDVDTGSYTMARRDLTAGRRPDPRSVRVEEFVNFFDYGDPPPARGDFALKAEGGPTPFLQSPNRRLLRFNIRARDLKGEHRRAAVLTFVVDVSGSMAQENRLGLVKKSLALLLDQLRPTDRVGVVVYGDTARLVLEPTGDREVARRAIDQLRPEGSTNVEAGLLLGYEVAARSFRANAANRIILCSDGVANVGRTGPRAILGQIERAAREGLELTTLGFGMSTYNDHLMEQLADKGDGRYAYVDSLKEAERVLVEELTGTLQTIAKDAKVQVVLNPAVVVRYRLLGYENRAIADERFRDDRVDAGEVGAGHSVTALYEVELRPGAARDGLIAALHLRYRSETGNQSETIKKLYVHELAGSWEQAPAGFRLAALVAQFAEILKGVPEARGADLGEVVRQVRRVASELPKSLKGERFTELSDLVERAARGRAQE